MNFTLLLKQSGSSIRGILVFVDSSFYRLCLAKPWAIPICQEKEQILIIQRRNVGSVMCGGEQAPASEFQGLFPEFCPNPSWILIPARSCSRQSPKTESKFLKEHYSDFWRGQTSSFHLCTWKVINCIVPEYSVWVIKIVSSQGGPPLVMKFRRAEYLLSHLLHRCQDTSCLFRENSHTQKKGDDSQLWFLPVIHWCATPLQSCQMGAAEVRKGCVRQTLHLETLILPSHIQPHKHLD